MLLQNKRIGKTAVLFALFLFLIGLAILPLYLRADSNGEATPKAYLYLPAIFRELDGTALPTATPTSTASPTVNPSITPTFTPMPTSTPTPQMITLYSNDLHDGDIRELDSTGTGDPVFIDNSGLNIEVGDNSDSDNSQYIGIVSFDTSVIPANADIVSVQLRLQQRNDLLGEPFGSQGLGNLYADIAPINGFSGDYALQATDFETFAAADNVITLSETFGDDQWSTGALEMGSFSLINVNGFTQFRIHFELPDDNDFIRDRFRFSSSDDGSNNLPPAPELIIFYYVP